LLFLFIYLLITYEPPIQPISIEKIDNSVLKQSIIDQIEIINNTPAEPVSDAKTADFSTSSEDQCVDSDGGKSFYTKGQVNTQENGQPSVIDICQGVILIEGYCNGNGATTESFNCPNGCFKGACVTKKNNNADCFDSDGGNNPSTFGYVRLGESLETQMDQCEGNNLLERVCENNIYETIKIPCLSGCINGVCIN
jgi:hypothetical protein